MIASASCLQCHGSYETAPDFVKRRFPPGHYSYHYRVGDVIGAVSVKIPLRELYSQLGSNVKLDILARGFVFLLIMQQFRVPARLQQSALMTGIVIAILLRGQIADDGVPAVPGVR